jgi:hypothetical protein
MRRAVAALIPIAAAGCLHAPIAAPGPVAFHSSRSAKEATQVTALMLTNAGFRVMQSDSTGNALTATRTATHNGNQEYVACQLPSGSGAAANRQTVLSLTFMAVPSTSGSDVTITSKVTTSYPGYEGTSMQAAPNQTDCVSNSTIESQLATALR